MKILEFSFKNICSYGNILQTFTFANDPQLVLIHGKSGSGKSSISEAIITSIYGKSSIRDIKDLPNRLNRNLYTYIKFVDDIGRIIEIERGIDPNFSNILINGEPHNLPDKRRVDDFVENELINIPFSVFSNTISLSINDFKSFVKLSPSDKKQIIDKIFGFESVNQLSSLAKSDIKQLKSDISVVSTKISTNSAILENTKSQLSELEIELKNDASNKKSEIISTLHDLRKTYTAAESDLQSISLSITEINSKISVSQQQINQHTSDLYYIRNIISTHKSGKCEHCLSDLHTAQSIEIYNELIEKEQSHIKLINSLTETISNYKIELTEKYSPIYEKTRSELYQIKSKLSTLELELSELDSNIDSNQKNRLESIIENLNNTIYQLSEHKTQLLDKLSIITELDSIFGENGIKRTLVSQIIPMLNEKMRKTCEMLEFPYQFEFDEDFNPIITDLGSPISIKSLSTGEQKKMNIIVLLAILELILLKHSNTNLLFLDEIFSSLDPDSIITVVSLLKEFAKAYNMTIFVISHTQLPQEYFDIKIKIDKRDCFSELTFE